MRLTKIANEPVADSLPLEEILRIDGYSYSRQERLFKEEFGITPHQYVTLLRVERIRQLLREGQTTISCIADEMGFNDLAYFSRYVKKHLGDSPRRMREILTRN
ncbi:MAG: helix-turn-helix transcriptional regulator [Kiritimatiellaeota bacterium]|nr:helix-turn-helix transcriptional regulator [Kiritimatiellota bacterium]